ncbi:PTS sugar transporter subunit IIA [Enterococcus faecalis]|jgi:Phosphotransferase system, mannose/fructose-specific component IIA|uniref:PTS sugar transporter subunit IIA n=1 Tax=Enterococcus TaxID=1350 RepID=UPI000B3CA133|nr:PTS fructose transporter subunit IIA [Enterococcus faecalis]ARV05067.1 PTS fructose transporter subunit IIA [Enterococcus faecalis]EGO8197564.1 PTS fructose transporter subunit IIA [Enterococcus faecalis]MBG9437457.1 PTS fructose transporter subunit IIA [Enterococcus faecalis]MBG9440179.1 PTS fructose transporter subunit IIA [Enterococcus faecalis]MBG9443013.1 PTS fructose transporter subunit IIA [Enterococcus faecalis]
MDNHLVLVSHGRFCEELKKSIEMIMGTQKEIYAVGLLPEESVKDFRVNFEKTIRGLKKVTVLADLMGGTPCNVVSQLILEGKEIDLYAGMNMPMIISFINNQILEEDSSLVDKGRKNIIHVNKYLKVNLIDLED